MASLTATTVNGDLTVTGKLNVSEEIETVDIENVSVINTLTTDDVTNTTGGIDVVTSTTSNLNHKVNNVQYKILDSGNYSSTLDNSYYTKTIMDSNTVTITGVKFDGTSQVFTVYLKNN